MNATLRRTAAVIGKDLRVELRTREVLYSSVLFAAVLVTLFIFGGFETSAMATMAAPGVMWVCIAFVGSLVFSRTFQRERDERAMVGLLMVPGMLDALFLGKLAVNWLLLSVVQVLLVPMVMIVFRAEVASIPLLTGIVLLGSLGFCALGTVLAAALATVRLREVLLPLVLYPLCIPLLVAAVRSTAALMRGATEGLGSWIGIMVTFDLLFLALARWLFAEAVDSGEM